MNAKFEDLNNYASHTYYGTTNEEPEVQRILLGNLSVRKAAGICSAGEVTLFTLLPRIRQELVLIDHSYLSLATAYVKALLLEKLGPVGLKHLIVNKPIGEFLAAIEGVKSSLPPHLATAIANMAKGKQGIFSTYEQDSLKREWFYASLPQLKRSARKLDRLTFVHGDLSDLKSKGPFDFLYLSNAQEHTDRTGGYPAFDNVNTLLTDKGYALLVAASKPAPKWKWDAVRDRKGFRTSWHYYLYRKSACIPTSPTTSTPIFSVSNSTAASSTTNSQPVQS